MNTGKKIIFENRMRKSYKVKCVDFEVKNERGTHVETRVQGLEGREFKLGERSVQQIKDSIAVMYEVEDLKNNNDNPAHITVYFGKDKEESNYY
jgi:hypothetical protein